MDYRNAIKWYQYDPTKWLITVCSWVGLASHLRSFPDSEIDKGRLTMELKRLKARQDNTQWPASSNDLPVINWESCAFFRFSILLVLMLLQSSSNRSHAR